MAVDVRLVEEPGAVDKLMRSDDVVNWFEQRGQRVARSAKRRAPRKTGELKSEIHSESGEDEESIYVDMISPRDKFQEKGHRTPEGTRVAARKYLRPALYAGRRRRR